MKKIIISILLVSLLLPVLASCQTGSSVTLSSLQVKEMPAKTTYLAGELFDSAGMIIAAVWSDGTISEIHTYTVDKTILTVSDTCVTVSYRDQSVSIPVTVTEDSTSSSDDSSEDSGESSFQPDDQTSFQLLQGPFKTLYTEGEQFDASGIIIQAIQGEQVTYFSDVTVSEAPLSSSDSSVSVSLFGNSFSVSVRVVPGSASVFSSQYTEQEYDTAVQQYASENEQLVNRNGDSFLAFQRLENPSPDGVTTTLDAFTQYLDYHIFYHIDSIIVKPEFVFSDFNSLLDSYYYRSGIIASNASLEFQPLDQGYYQVLVKYYDSVLLNSGRNGAVNSCCLTPDLSFQARDDSYVPPMLDNETGITVYTSEQVSYALCQGYKISPVKGSPAETIVQKATDLLRTYCSDRMTEFEKMYSLYNYFVQNTVYDQSGELWAGSSLDCINESDMFASLLVSFHAEGPLLYGNSVCYGYAKAMAILLGLEGLEVKRVVAQDEATTGRSSFRYDEETQEYDPAFLIHSYDYVRIQGKDYLCDITFSYAGTLEIENQSSVWYRDFSLAISKETHRTVYSELLDDWYCSSPDYTPAEFSYLQEFPYDGIHSGLLQNDEELNQYLEYLETEMNSGTHEIYSCIVPVRTDAFDYQTVRDKIQSFFSRRSSSLLFGAAERTIDEASYYEFLILLKR